MGVPVVVEASPADQAVPGVPANPPSVPQLGPPSRAYWLQPHLPPPGFPPSVGGSHSPVELF